MSSIDFTLSIQNVALLNAISCSIVDTLKTPEIEPNLLPLSTVELSKIKKLSSALQKNDDAWESESAALAAGSAGVAAGDDPTAEDPGGPAAKSGPRVPARKIRVNVTVPDVSFAVVNDLQGFDTALFKVIAQTLVGGGSISLPASGADPFARKKEEGPSATQFEFHLAAYFQADYYDVSTNLWEAFLVKPLEITVNGKRDREKKFGSNRMISCLDVESHPCHVSFSEQFLVSIGAATNMWSLYSGAINNAVGVDGKKATSRRPPNAEPTAGEKLKKSMAANAARALVTTLPYVIDNRAGAPAFFSLDSGGPAGECRCESSETRHFRFEFPPASGRDPLWSLQNSMTSLRRSLRVHLRVLLVWNSSRRMVVELLKQCLLLFLRL